jgi:uncharacterized LabA/DUF88 family protein
MTDDGRGSRGGSSGGSRGRGGSSSFIASRRPSQPKESASETKPAATPASRRSASSDADQGAHDDARPKRRRRRPAAKSEAQETTSTKAAEPAAAPPAVEAGEEKAAEAAEASAAAGSAAARPAAARAAEKAPARTRSASADGDDDADLAAIRRLVEEQGASLAELRDGFATLENRIEQASKRARLGVFVDVPNLLYGQDADEQPINAGKLLALIGRGRELVRATAYSPVSDDPSESLEQQKFVAPFVPYEYRIVTKPLKRFADGSIKGNFDVEMAIDMITMADRLDVIAIVSGDADFARAVETVQSRGVRVEVVAFARSTSLEMRALADHYVELGKIVETLR